MGGIYKDGRWEEKIRCVWYSGRIARTFEWILKPEKIFYIALVIKLTDAKNIEDEKIVSFMKEQV